VSVLSLALSHLLVAYAALVEPVLGVRLYRRLEQAAARSGEARVRFYRLSLAFEWTWALVVLLIVVLGGPSLAELGLRWEAPPARVIGFVVAAVLGSLMPLAIFWVRSRKPGGPAVGESMRRMLEPVGALLPDTPKERRLFGVLVVTAGVCEELLFRGFLLFYLQEVFPGLPLWAAVVGSSAVFGIAHLYQGLGGVLGTAGFGAAMAVLYVASGSLIVPILLHALLDLRILLLHRPREGGSVT